MKLFPILFLNEEMRYGSDALANNLAASSHTSRITLFDPIKLKEFVNKKIQEKGKITTDDTLKTGKDRGELLRHEVERKITTDDILEAANVENKIIIGTIDFSNVDSEISAVLTSAAIDGFGPLMYQFAMYEIKPKFLACDVSLKPASLTVWQKMYEFSNKGMYERVFLRTFNREMFLNRIHIHDSDTLSNYLGEDNGDPSEKRFLDWLKEKNIDPKNFGFLWAYRKKDFDSSFGQLLSKGRQVTDKITITMPSSDAATLVTRIARVFFTNMYGSEASYTEE